MIQVTFQSTKALDAVPDFFPADLVEKYKENVLRFYCVAPYEFELQHPQAGDVLEFKNGVRFRKDKHSGVDAFDVSRRIRILAASVMSEGMAESEALHDTITGWAGMLANAGAAEELAQVTIPYILQDHDLEEAARDIVSATYASKEEGATLAGSGILRDEGWEEAHVAWLESILGGEEWNQTLLSDDAYRILHWVTALWDSGMRSAQRREKIRIKDLVPLVEADSEIKAAFDVESSYNQTMTNHQIGSALTKLQGKPFTVDGEWREVKLTTPSGVACFSIVTSYFRPFKNGKE